MAGHDVVNETMAIRRLIGLAGQSASVEEMMTGRENLAMVARLYSQSRKTARRSADRILELVDLRSAADRNVKTYSGGMRRRLDLGPASSALPVFGFSTNPPPALTRAVASSFGMPSVTWAMPEPTSC